MRRVAVCIGLAACGSDGGSSTPVDAQPCVDVSHDEDGDGIGDACDICPAAPDPAQRDSTEAATMLAFPDGVGDACDPRGNLSGDKLAAFHPFADAAAQDDWTGGGWSTGADRARATDAARWVAKSRELGDGLFVQARIASLVWQSTGSFEIVVDGDGVDSGLACVIAKDRDGDGSDELDAHERGGALMTKSVGMPITGAVTLTAWRSIDVMRRGTLRCRLTFAGGGAVLDLPTSDDAAVGLYGFAQQAATTEVNSLVVYTSPTLPDKNLAVRD